MSGHLLHRVGEELDRVLDGGGRVAIWWRDDDAVRHTPALDRLLDFSRAHACPLALAVIPAGAQSSLVERLGEVSDVSVLVHGYEHRNHAGVGEKSAEFGAHRPVDVMADEAGRGRDRLRSMFGGQLADVFVPPWNRIAPELVPALGRAGYRALSTFGGSFARRPDGLVVLDTHLDPVDWRGTRGPLDENAFATMFVRALAVTDEGRAGPIGLLTHHLKFDDELWTFCARLTELLSSHPAVEWVSINAAIAADGLRARHNVAVPSSLMACPA